MSEEEEQQRQQEAVETTPAPRDLDDTQARLAYSIIEALLDHTRAPIPDRLRRDGEVSPKLGVT